MSFTAKFENDEIIIIESVYGIASSKEDAILFLINSYVSKIQDEYKMIKELEAKIKELRRDIPELMYEQRKIVNRFDSYKKTIDK